MHKGESVNQELVGVCGSCSPFPESDFPKSDISANDRKISLSFTHYAQKILDRNYGLLFPSISSTTISDRLLVRIGGPQVP